eukprot:GSChrysophyteH1.ASY1.ANO1.1358.1 assembled CDS
MSLRGVKQLRELVVRYSDIDGSSRGIREWIKKDLTGLAAANPETIFRTELKRCKHPFLRGVYINGNEKTIGVKNLEADAIQNYALDLRNQIGRKNSSTGYKRPILSSRPSIQGEWHERMNMNFDLKVEHK